MIVTMDYLREGHIYTLLRNMMVSTRRNRPNKGGVCFFVPRFCILFGFINFGQIVLCEKLHNFLKN